MAVLAEGISVIIRAEPLLRALDDDFEGFKATVPNATLCADGELVRVGFMAPADAEAFVGSLASIGLRYLINGEAQDLSVVDQLRGPAASTPWLEFGHIDWRGDPKKKVACCRQKGTAVGQVVTPEGWEYEQSLTASFLFVPEKSAATLERLGKKDGIDEVRTPLSAKKFYQGRVRREL